MSSLKLMQLDPNEHSIVNCLWIRRPELSGRKLSIIFVNTSLHRKYLLSDVMYVIVMYLATDKTYNVNLFVETFHKNKNSYIPH